MGVKRRARARPRFSGRAFADASYGTVRDQEGIELWRVSDAAREQCQSEVSREI